MFLVERPARMRGIGEQLEPCTAPSAGSLVVAFPGVGLDTRLVYAKYDDLLTMEGSVSSIRPLTPGQGRFDP
jgi:4-diphosphocytidyl-2C-methyl-D-erythritol kinase